MRFTMLPPQFQQLFADFRLFSLFFVFSRAVAQFPVLDFSNPIPRKKSLYGAIATQDKISCLRHIPNKSNLRKPLSPIQKMKRETCFVSQKSTWF
jgi:hypothetical protein